MQRFRFEMYPFLEREFQTVFIIYFSYTYEPYLLHNQPNKFHEGTYDVRIQIQFVLHSISSYLLLHINYLLRIINFEGKLRFTSKNQTFSFPLPLPSFSKSTNNYRYVITVDH